MPEVMIAYIYTFIIIMTSFMIQHSLMLLKIKNCLIRFATLVTLLFETCFSLFIFKVGATFLYKNCNKT